MEYLNIIIFMLLAGVLTTALLFIPFFLGKNTKGKYKKSQYECGIDPEDISDKPLNLKFILVAILFLIFDLEIAFLLPWVIQFKEISNLGFWSMISFLSILAIGFIYEFKTKSLIWNK